MKLLDMLVDAGLNKGFEWPDGFYYCAQDSDNAVVLCSKVMRSVIGNLGLSWCAADNPATYDEICSFRLAEDYQTSQITKQEYLSALEKAKKELISKAEPEGIEELDESMSECAYDIDAGVISKPAPLETMPPVWKLPNMLTEYSRKKESFSLLEKELDEKRKELYELQENIRILCEQQGWRIEPV